MYSYSSYLSFYIRPTTLRPSYDSYQFTPSIIQALYHIPVFQEAVLAYRPSLESWGCTDEYWRGTGPSLPEMQLMQVTEDEEIQLRYATLAESLPSAMKGRLGGDLVGITFGHLREQEYFTFLDDFFFFFSFLFPALFSFL